MFKIGIGHSLRQHFQNFNDAVDVRFVKDKNRRCQPVQVGSKEIQSKFLQFLSSRKYYAIVRTVECWLSEENGTVSEDSARKVMNSVGCCYVRVKIFLN